MIVDTDGGAVNQERAKAAAVLASIREQIDALLAAIEDADLEVIDRLGILQDLVERASAARTDTVGEAWEYGHTWEEIGASLGVTRQAAQKRYGQSVRQG